MASTGTMSSDPGHGSGGVSGLRALAFVGELGTVMAVCIVGGVLGGVGLSRLLGVKWVMILPVLVGILAGVFSVYRLLSKEVNWKH